MIAFMVLAALAFAAVVVFSVLASVFGLVFHLVFLPFRLVAWALKGLALVLVLPFVALFGVIAFVALGAGMLMFLFPVIPFALIALGAWWLVRRRHHPAASATS
ncbi:MAG: hypothetical protein HY076_08075 [Candidatus Eisenbacteria bacterium]|uniref:Uncharacterized protein n=1 Tax=Eiseniibacteriota bacterium TaxID=2212470 RepID=A0A9D6LBQ5_UNCEI|nr:hypothetical protein [Candidatus Eisenbacteria bacterium]MBI3540213.1 hypothetical protein [Candidatus Eisenbacteria bacterium]